MEVNTLNNVGGAAQSLASSVSTPKAMPKNDTSSASKSDVQSIDAVSSGMTPKNFVNSSSENSHSKNNSNSNTNSSVSATAEISSSTGLSAIAAKVSQQQKESVEEIQASMDRAISDANSKLSDFNKSLKYSVHDATNTVMVKMVDSETDEVIREYPSETRLDAMARVRELAGVLVDVRK